MPLSPATTAVVLVGICVGVATTDTAPGVTLSACGVAVAVTCCCTGVTTGGTGVDVPGVGVGGDVTVTVEEFVPVVKPLFVTVAVILYDPGTDAWKVVASVFKYEYPPPTFKRLVVVYDDFSKVPPATGLQVSVIVAPTAGVPL
jgi:hypothetical protein